MATKSKSRKPERLRRSDPERGTPNRSPTDHIRNHSGSGNGNGGNKQSGPKSQVSETLQKAIADIVELSSTVIEDQIRAGQTAAERLRDGISGSERLNKDVTALVDGLVTTTKDVGATWLELLSIVLRSIGKEPSPPPGGGRPPPGSSNPSRTKTVTGTSGGAATTSSITPNDPTIEPVPLDIVVTGTGVKSVTLDLRPPSLRFVPFLHELQGRDPKYSLATVEFTRNDKGKLVLSVRGQAGQHQAVYAGVVVDSYTNEPGGTVSVTIGR
ncbi:hypothetical protein [Bradyrhizobium sp. WSM471]|uniref:hypothetical protein n=1 Tax=Bradyrhizobium sp. WSM471 TaxID=319017 RepID=UPI00024D1B98|nr:MULTISPECIES: hypothetical protein [Bradyrhizobium]EHR00244.1 hypothetical protein Bra471DRAFT_00802 [Bradyrhizobium sp. WSM471]UFW42362.1 hypothetical protein BcanWSM471_03920 [Bradyrhizobium canariense]